MSFVSCAMGKKKSRWDRVKVRNATCDFKLNGQRRPVVTVGLHTRA
jgi:hypothetical protein